MAVILPSVYKDGTATIAANGTAVTGQNTLWLNSVLPGDFWGVHKGLPIRIATVNSNTSITLANPWPGAAQTAAAYEIMLQSDNARMQETSRQLLSALSSGNAYALSNLASAADTLGYFTGSGTMALTGLSPFMRTVLDDLNQTTALATLGANNAANLTTGTLLDARISATLTPDKAFRRGNIVGTVSQSAGVPTGAIIERGSNANGEYVRFADGTQICTIRTSSDIATTIALGAIFISDLISYTVPVNFVGTPTGSISISNGWALNANTSNTAMVFRVADSSSRTATRNVQVTIVGRWF